MLTAVIILAVVALALGAYIVFDILHGKKKEAAPEASSEIYYPHVELEDSAPTESAEEDVQPTDTAAESTESADDVEADSLSL